MKSATKKVLGLLAVCIGCLVIFIGVGFAYLTADMRETEKTVPKEPYVQSNPENCGIMFDILGNCTFLHLNFDKKKVSVIVLDDEENLYGYSVDYTIKGDYNLVASIIDFVDGIELNLSGENLNYTGVQVIEKLTRTVNNYQLKQQVILSVLKGISQKGISREELVYIIENSETDLTVPDCYIWPNYLEDICKNTEFIN